MNGSLGSDMRVAIRMFLRRPSFTATAMLCLTLGIGSATTIFTLINAIFLRQLPLAEPERLVAVFGSDQQAANATGLSYLTVSLPNYRDLALQTRTLSSMAGYSWTPVSLAGEGEPERVYAQIVTTNYFGVLGVHPTLGRAFEEADDRSPVAILSHTAWRDRFGGDPRIIGRTLLINTHRFTIIGVAPEGFGGTSTLGSPELWVPLGMHPQVYPFTSILEQRKWRTLNVVGRLARSATLGQARSELKSIAARLELEYPDDNRGRGFKALSLPDTVVPPDLMNQLTLAGAIPVIMVVLVLLIACISVACLLLARATTRHHEMAIRVSLGATRTRVIRQLLTESLLLAACGGALGLLLANWSKNLLWNFRPPFLANVNAVDLRQDGAVLGFVFGISLLTGVLFGLAPAIQSSRPQLFNFLRSRVPVGRRQFSSRNILMIAQIALSTVSLIGAGLFLRSLRNAQNIDLGFNADNLIVMSFDLFGQGQDLERAKLFQERLLEEVRSMPGVQGATLSETAPLDPAVGAIRRVIVEGEDADPTGGIHIRSNGVSPGFFEVLGISLQKGRTFSAADRVGSPRVAVINEAMAKSLWPGKDPLSRHFFFVGEDDPVEVVGVARDSRYTAVATPPQPYIYLPLAQRGSLFVSLLIRSASAEDTISGPVHKRIRSLDPSLPIINSGPVSQRIASSLWAPRMAAWLLGIFGILALVITSIGLYGVMTFSVAQRNREIGIRMSLGARRGEVLWLVLRQSLIIAATGASLGLGVAFAGNRALQRLLYGVAPSDVRVLTAVVLILLVVVVVATLIPARRASRVNPAAVLRLE